MPLRKLSQPLHLKLDINSTCIPDFLGKSCQSWSIVISFLLYCPVLGLTFALHGCCHLTLPSPFVPSEYWTQTSKKQIRICLVSLQLRCQESYLNALSLLGGTLSCESWMLKYKEVPCADSSSWLVVCDRFPGVAQKISMGTLWHWCASCKGVWKNICL